MNHTAEEVRWTAQSHADRGNDNTAAMLRAYADMIEADEAKALGTCPKHGVEYVGECSGCAMTLPEKDFTRPPAQATQGDWRIGFFERWREAAHEKGYAGIAEAITAAPTVAAPSPADNILLDFK